MVIRVLILCGTIATLVAPHTFRQLFFSSYALEAIIYKEKKLASPEPEAPTWGDQVLKKKLLQRCIRGKEHCLLSDPTTLKETRTGRQSNTDPRAGMLIYPM
jgi:hypothetical protein